MSMEPIFLSKCAHLDEKTRKRMNRYRFAIIIFSSLMFWSTMWGCEECEEIERQYLEEQLQVKGRDFRGGWVRDTWICWNPKCRKRNFEEQTICSGCRSSRP